MSRKPKEKKWDSPEGFLDWFEQWEGLTRFAKTFRPAMLWILSILIVLVVFLIGKAYVNRIISVPVDPDSQVMMGFDIYRGDSLSVISRRLEEKELIRNRLAFKLYSDFNNKSDALQAGRYYISPSMTMEEILDIFTAGQDRAGTVRVTLTEGMTLNEMVAAFEKKGLLIGDKQNFLHIVKTGEGFTDREFVKNMKNKTEREYLLEGYLFPDTYEFYLSANAYDIVEKLVNRFEDIYEKNIAAEAKKKNLTMDEVITMASIIEKEAKEADFYKVSAVLYNRLKKDMSLDMDSTIKYITGSKKMIIDDQLDTDSPYNTYKHKGLPPGPICNPGKAAMLAALSPDSDYVKGGYLYFTTKNPADGDLEFSKTAAQHKAAVNKYKPLWAQYDEEHNQ